MAVRYGVKIDGEIVEAFETKEEAESLVKELTENHNKAELVEFEAE